MRSLCSEVLSPVLPKHEEQRIVDALIIVFSLDKR